MKGPVESDIDMRYRRGMPPRKLYPETILIRAPEGTQDRLRAVLRGDETAADVLRELLEREIARRERAAEKPKSR